MIPMICSSFSLDLHMCQVQTNQPKNSISIHLQTLLFSFRLLPSGPTTVNHLPTSSSHTNQFNILDKPDSLLFRLSVQSQPQHRTANIFSFSSFHVQTKPYYQLSYSWSYVLWSLPRRTSTFGISTSRLPLSCLCTFIQIIHMLIQVMRVVYVDRRPFFHQFKLCC